MFQREGKLFIRSEVEEIAQVPEGGGGGVVGRGEVEVHFRSGAVDGGGQGLRRRRGEFHWKA